MDLKNNQKVALSLLFTYDDGHTATAGAPGDVPVWVKGGDDVIDIAPAADGLTAEANGKGTTAGTATVTVTAADNVSGMVTDSLTIVVSVVASKIISVQIVPGVIESQ